MVKQRHLRLTPDEQLEKIIIKNAQKEGLKPATYAKSLLIKYFQKTGEYKHDYSNS